MRFNEKELRYVSRKISADREGRLAHKPPRENGYKERWFKLMNNLLFYYRTDHGVMSETEACGILVLEKCRTQIEVDGNSLFVFSIVFEDDRDKKHMFSGQNENQIREWMDAINRASFDHLRSKIQVLRSQIAQRRGKGPALALSEQQVRPSMQETKEHHRIRQDKHFSLFFPSEIGRKDIGEALLVDL
ncbi:pleckstrin homology domain-containing family J member 1 [Lingula anatina]|uniref:Pleckstrin homology domain-containing family J member 1 n=1 Tax=Lingula anatina TaxID=7574 RepID=A0A1S3JAE2_LINAN|nr:pleckstrin homology domain-containing family J member 1 [Lingula anatina]|eukprot:XP_013407367.1 pleckstrin homology domain-containing family J member 1 [Lingula anatina]